MLQKLSDIVGVIGIVCLFVGAHFAMAMLGALFASMIADGISQWQWPMIPISLGFVLFMLYGFRGLVRADLHRHALDDREKEKHQIRAMYWMWITYAVGVVTFIASWLLFAPISEQPDQWPRVAIVTVIGIGLIAFLFGSYIKDQILAYAWKKDRQANP